MNDNSIPPDDRSPKSASEIIQRGRRDQQNNGAPLGRAHTEIFRPLGQRVVNILIRQGHIAATGLKSFRVDGGSVDVELLSPLAQAHQINELESLIKFVEISQAAVGQAFPLAVKVEDIPEIIAEHLSLDTERLIRSEQDRAMMLKAVGTAQQQQNAPEGAPA